MDPSRGGCSRVRYSRLSLNGRPRALVDTSTRAVNPDAAAYEPAPCATDNPNDWIKGKCVRGPRKLLARKKKADRIRRTFQRRVKPLREFGAEQLWISCGWPYSLRAIRNLAEQRKAQQDGYVKLQRDKASRWPPHGCGGKEEPELQNSGGTLMEARRNPGFFPPAASPFSDAATAWRNQPTNATALGDLVRSNGYDVPPAPAAPSSPRGTRPRAGGGVAGPGGAVPEQEITIDGLCVDIEGLGQSCIWPYTIAPIRKLLKDGPQGIAWVPFNKLGKSRWPPVGCRLGPPPVLTWWILDFVRGFLGIQNPPLNIRPAPIRVTQPPAVRAANSTAPTIEAKAPVPVAEPPPVVGVCTYVWRWRGVGNPATTFGPPASDPEGRLILSQADYVASPYVLISRSGPPGVNCGTDQLRSK